MNRPWHWQNRQKGFEEDVVEQFVLLINMGLQHGITCVYAFVWINLFTSAEGFVQAYLCEMVYA